MAPNDPTYESARAALSAAKRSAYTAMTTVAGAAKSGYSEAVVRA
jgi:hypothetical protein